MKKRQLITFISMLLLVFILSACVSPKSSTKDTTGPTDAGEKVDVVGKVEKEPPAELSWFFHCMGTTWQEFDFANNWFMDFIEEKANVKFTDVTIPPHADIKTKFNMLVASGELMDVMSPGSTKDEIDEYGQDGAFLQLDKYIDESPVLSKLYDSSQREYIKAEDGKSYCLYGNPTNVDFNTYSGFGYRADLLDKVGLEVPTTLDGWVDVMRKIQKEIPNTILYSTCKFDQYYEFMFSPFNIHGFYIYDDDTHTFIHPCATENIVQAVSFGRMLFQEGLLDNEFMSHTKADYTNKIYANNMFIVVKNRYGITNFTLKYPSNGVSGAMLTPAWYPAAEGIEMKDGVFKHWGDLVGSKMVIGSKTKHPEACIRVLETLLSEEARDLVIYGREGHEYEIKNGIKTPIEPANTETGWRLAYGILIGMDVKRIEYNEESTISSSPGYTPEERIIYKDKFQDAIKKFDEFVFTNKPRGNSYSAPLDSEFFIKEGNTKEYQKSILAKTIMGDMSIEEFKEEAKKIAADDADLIDAKNKLMQEAVKKYGLK
jgi:putative aldouronate transport system substrate-binding protein